MGAPSVGRDRQTFWERCQFIEFMRSRKNTKIYKFMVYGILVNTGIRGVHVQYVNSGVKSYCVIVDTV